LQIQGRFPWPIVRKFRVDYRERAIYFCNMMNDYEKVEKAIVFLKDNFKRQPDLDEVAGEVFLSPFHFQRLFKEWAGVSPKKFLQFTSLEYAKGLLKQNYSLADTSFETGLSGTGRLHDLFVTIEGMTPGEFKNGGSELDINYSFAETLFGDIIIASTLKGICYLAFRNSGLDDLEPLRKLFPNARLQQKTDLLQQKALHFFRGDMTDLESLRLHLKATPFQLKVWNALLHIPLGGLSTYKSIAKSIEQPQASRAVGTAIGSNPIAYIIPCHRVIRSSGISGDYHWGPHRKTAMIGWEAARVNKEE
jgi:AraC family transcriptional regulator of adaptative response/methylated-DNA-[protein]-cysteine methyltransferase